MSLRRRRFATLGSVRMGCTDQRPLSRVMYSRLDPEWAVHAMMLSIQQVL